MTVKTWSGSEIDIAWYELRTWWRWLLGHARTLATAEGRRDRRRVRAELAADQPEDLL